MTKGDAGSASTVCYELFRHSLEWNHPLFAKHLFNKLGLKPSLPAPKNP